MNHWEDKIWLVSYMVGLEKYGGYGEKTKNVRPVDAPWIQFHCIEHTHGNDSCGGTCGLHSL